ncbi:hypothetical protein BE20_07145 [Sorangium cellulosum]|nr:hypothetical protein BE20_07145 [Sorangium cellulosum]
MESVAALLSGRAAPWPLEGEFRTNWPESERFCGQSFRIEAVDQRKVAELMARPGVFWLVFAPSPSTPRRERSGRCSRRSAAASLATSSARSCMP